MRDRALIDLRTPILFVQGMRDGMRPLDRLDEIRAKMKAQAATQADVDLRIGQAIAAFLGSLIP